MTKVFITKHAEEKLRHIPNTLLIRKAMRELSKSQFKDIKSIPGTDLFVKKAGNYRLILSKENGNILIVSILTKEKLLDELDY